MHTLPTFRAVARVSNLRSAAEALHLTHSAVSQQIRLLEEQLGFELFDRRGRRMALNAAGAALLRAVELSLDQLDDGVREATAAAYGAEHRIRITLVPSFAQRWLLPRMGSWRAQHPDIGIELHASQQVVDLQRDGFQAALRQGSGQWRGVEAERLLDSPLIAVGSPSAARRLLGGDAHLADEPLLGSPATWERWFALSGLRVKVRPVAAFNDAGMMLQAAEQELGIALARELLAADALHSGRLVRLSPIALPDDEEVDTYWLVYPPALRDWPPLQALRTWLHDELALSQRQLAGDASTVKRAARKATADRSGSRSRARSA